MVLSCDLITDAPLSIMTDLHRSKGALMTCLFSGPQASGLLNSSGSNAPDSSSLTDPRYLASLAGEEILVALDMSSMTTLSDTTNSVSSCDLIYCAPQADSLDETNSFLPIKMSTLFRYPKMRLRTDLLDPHCYLFSPAIFDVIEEIINTTSKSGNTNTNANTRTRTTTPSNFPIVSFSFGISRAPDSGPSDIQWLFNNVNAEEMNEMFSNAGSGTGTGTGNTPFFGITTIPMMISGDGNAASSGELLTLARQMFQIISSIRSASPNSTSAAPNANTANSPQEFLQSLNRLFAMDTANANANVPFVFPPQQQVDLESVLNEFFSRIFELGMESSGPVGLSTEQISRLPDTTEQNFDCAICRESVGEKNEVEAEAETDNGNQNNDVMKCVQLPCKHSFHFECIEPWLKRVPSCPICRKLVVMDEEQTEQ